MPGSLERGRREPPDTGFAGRDVRFVDRGTAARRAAGAKGIQ